MASEPSDEGLDSISLPADLQEWLESQAAQLGVDEETVVEQLLASYRAAEKLDGDLDPDELGAVEPDRDVVEGMVREIVRERLDDIASAVEERVDGDSSEEEFRAELDRIESSLGDQISRTQSDFQEKLEDVRERVIQVKRETDDKAPADHDHADLRDSLDDLEATVDTLRTELQDEVDDELDAYEERLDAVDDRLEEVEDKLRTVAWVVSDLRDAHANDSGSEDTVKRLKKTAAEQGFDRAQCENCGNSVQLGLLTEPNCPHCDATVSDVEGSAGFFGRPRLVVAKQLEAGDDESSRGATGASAGR